MKIGDLARASGLTERMLRHYEELGIIKPARSEGGTRQYDTQDVAVARLIQQLRVLDIPLATIAEIALERPLHDTGDASGQSVGQLLDGLSENLADLAERALMARRIVADAQATVAQCKGCENRPGPETCPDCPMNEKATENAVAAMIWR